MQRNNRPMARPVDSMMAAPAVQPSSAASAARTKTRESTKRSKKPLLIIVAVVLLAALAGVLWYMTNRNSVASTIDGSKYQVVVIRDSLNAPTYYGKLSVVNANYFRLTHVYYLKKKTDGSSATTQSVTGQSASDFELIKLGNEIYGPEDEIIIPKDQLLYFENLKPSGTVSKTITDYESKNK